jgi:multidrug efflux pump subunit AcrA (membrane-fusion protein)
VSSHPDERVPRRPARRRSRWVSALIALILVGAASSAAAYYFLTGATEPFNGPTWTVKKERLKLAIVERGALESAENSDIVVRVKQGKKTTATTIKWVIDDGTQVEKGQKLVELDDSALQEELKERLIEVNKAEAAWITAREKCEITQSQNDSEIETAKTALLLAKIALKKFLGEEIAKRVEPIKDRLLLSKYLEGDLETDLKKQYDDPANTASEIFQTVSDIEGRVKIEQSNLGTTQDRASWSQRMLKRGYLSRSVAESDQARLDSAKFNVRKVEGELGIFLKFTIEEKITDLWSKVKEAERALDRTVTQAKSKINADISDRDSKRDIFEQEHARKLEIEDEISKCVIYSPQSGLVVYYLSEQSRFGGGSQQSIVAQGEPVREGQKLMRIPNLSRMLVNVRVHEAMVSRLKGEVLRPTGYSDTLRAGFSMGRPLLDVVAHLVAMHETRDDFREKDYDVVFPGQRATIRVDAHSSKLFNGRVKSVATVASQAEFFSSDVKVYPTMVSIDESVVNLKPGMSAEVTIVAEESSEPVLTIPIQSVVGSIAMGSKRKCYVLEDSQPKERDITIGRSNDKMVEVVEGVEEGEQVVLNPRPLLGENSGMKVGTPSSRRGGGDAGESGPGGEGKKWGGKKGGGGFDPSKMKGGGPDGPPGLNPGGAGGQGGPGRNGAFQQGNGQGFKKS